MMTDYFLSSKTWESQWSHQYSCECTSHSKGAKWELNIGWNNEIVLRTNAWIQSKSGNLHRTIGNSSAKSANPATKIGIVHQHRPTHTEDRTVFSSTHGMTIINWITDLLTMRFRVMKPSGTWRWMLDSIWCLWFTWQKWEWIGSVMVWAHVFSDWSEDKTYDWWWPYPLVN